MADNTKYKLLIELDVENLDELPDQIGHITASIEEGQRKGSRYEERNGMRWTLEVQD